MKHYLASFVLGLVTAVAFYEYDNLVYPALISGILLSYFVISSYQNKLFLRIWHISLTYSLIAGTFVGILILILDFDDGILPTAFFFPTAIILTISTISLSAAIAIHYLLRNTKIKTDLR